MSYSVKRQAGLTTVAVNEFEWTADVPTEAGVYWIKWEDGGVEIAEIDREGYIFRAGDDRYLHVEEVALWLGPIPEPFPKGF